MITKELKKNNILPIRIYDAPKHFYNTYQKMTYRDLPYTEISDNFAIKIIINEIEHCYSALGIVHKLFTPLHDRFKDYIATPKSNLYQSLHTAVIGPDGKVVEIQIKTEKMDLIAELGVIYNWLNSKGTIKKKVIQDQYILLKKVLELKDDTNEPDDFVENFKGDLVHDEVFIFTPKGDLQRLPRGATPVDFAFHIHSDIGFHCIGAKVNRKIVPLSYQLQNGDIIEIITSKKHQPDPAWIQFVVTAKARSKLKRYLKELKQHKYTKLGRRLLEAELKKFYLDMTDADVGEITQSFGMDTADQLYAAIGGNEINVKKVVTKFLADLKNEGPLDTLLEPEPAADIRQGDAICVDGMDETIHLAYCCQPIPGDRILGFLKIGGGVEVHRTECRYIVELMQTPQNSVQVEWAVEKNRKFLSTIKIIAHSRQDFLIDLSALLADCKVNVVNMVLSSQTEVVHNQIAIEVKSLSQLKQVMTGIMKIHGVISVARVNGDGN